jgi:hypothetical protein
LFSRAPIVRGETIYQRALPRPGRARDTNDVGAAGRRKNLLQQLFGVRIVVLDCGDGACDGAHVSSADLIGPSVDA